ncbi:class I adenylate-forming enzyme family protein [Chloroflexota bacterium]
MTDKYILKELCRYTIGTYADVIYRNALLHPDSEAFIYKSRRITFSEYNTRVNSLINSLRKMGVKRGDVIGILSYNCLEYADFFGAAWKGGYIASPFNFRLQASELEYLINYSEATTLLVGPEFIDAIKSLKGKICKVNNFISIEGTTGDMVSIDELRGTESGEEPDIQVDEDDPLAIVYTSGTTGLPRGALYTQRRFMDNTKNLVMEMGLQPGNKHIQVMPLFHIGGIHHFRAFLYIAGSNVIMHQRSFDPAATLQVIQDEKATDIDIVATHLVAMLAVPDKEKYDISSLKRMWYAASPMPVEVLKKGIETWGPIFAQGYGQTETGPEISDLTREDGRVVDKSPEEQKILASAGRPSYGVHVRIVDQDNIDVAPGEMGEIIVQSKHLMVEYWNMPDDTNETLIDGWVYTGDVGYYDNSGYVYIVDRRKDMVVSGGENIYPREVEEVLYGHPAVREAAVIGIPDSYWVEKVHAVISLNEGAAVTEEEIINFCKDKLARYKAPKSVEFIEAIPKNPSGKILKRELRDKYWEGSDRKV